MIIYLRDELNGSGSPNGASAQVNFPTAQTWVSTDTLRDGIGGLGADGGSVAAGGFGTATYGPATSTNVGAALVFTNGPGSGAGADLRVNFITPSVVESAAFDDYLAFFGMYVSGQYYYGRLMLLAGDPVGSVYIRVYHSGGQTSATIAGVLPNKEYTAVLRVDASGAQTLQVFGSSITVARSISDTNGVHRVMLQPSLIAKITSVSLTEMTYSASIAAAAPSAYLVAGASTIGSLTASLVGPVQTLSAGGAPQHIDIYTPPSPVLSGFMGGWVNARAPSAEVLFLGQNAPNLFKGAAPSPTLSAFLGAWAKPVAPRGVLGVSATFTTYASAALNAPSPLVVSSGVVSAVATAALAPSAPVLAGYFGALMSLSVTGSPTLLCVGTTGSVGYATLTAPLFDLTSGGTAQNHGSAILAAPVGRLATTGAAWLIAPGAQLTAIGTAVVAVTYEAYALNLKHNPVPGKEPIDEMTHYTNYPFDRIVRYKNSYFGMNSTGLYLLEGTTDNATPIPYEVKTHVTDFDATEQKTVVSAYMGGRMGAAETVTLFAGEKTSNAYPYTTPRGATPQNYRQKFGRGIKARYYGIGFKGDKEFDLDTLELEINKLPRRI